MTASSYMEALMNAGVGAFIAMVILTGLYRIVRGLGEKFIEAQHRQAEAQGAQAQSLAGLTASIREATGKDNTEHREMLTLLRFIAQRQQSFEEVRVEHRKRKEQAHPHCTFGTP
jgi:hypothetical protein